MSGQPTPAIDTELNPIEEQIRLVGLDPKVMKEYFVRKEQEFKEGAGRITTPAHTAALTARMARVKHRERVLKRGRQPASTSTRRFTRRFTPVHVPPTGVGGNPNAAGTLSKRKLLGVKQLLG